VVTLTFILTLLAVLTCVACTVLLFRGYASSGSRLVLWTAACFIGLSLNNLALFLDLVVFTDIDLRLYRQAAALAGLACLLYGFIWGGEE
jgi:hypothetical protein